jgi:hypothetical protein
VALIGSVKIVCKKCHLMILWGLKLQSVYYIRIEPLDA